MRTERRRKNGYLLPVVSVCTGRQVRLAPPSCCHRPPISFILCTCTSAKQSDCLPTASFIIIATRISIILIRSVFPLWRMNLILIRALARARARGAHSSSGGRAMRRMRVREKGRKQRDRASFCITVNLWKSVRIPSRFISALSFHLLSRRALMAHEFSSCVG